MFKKAIPIFAHGKEWNKNTHIVLRGLLPSLKKAVIRIAAASFYRLTVNGSFVSFGPARTAKGYARVDEIPLDNFHNDVENEVVIEAVGYACRSLSLPYEPSFVCAEIEADNHIVLATGTNFECFISAKYLQKTERYSVQRQFSEICDERPKNIFDEKYRVQISEIPSPVFLPRRVPMPSYREAELRKTTVKGTFTYDASLPCKNNRYSFHPDERWGMYKEEEIPLKPFRWVQKQAPTPTSFDSELPISLASGEYAIFDLSKIEVGFIKSSFSCYEESDIVIAFSELCEKDKFEFTDINCQNVLEYLLPEGNTQTMSFEPYSLRFAAIFVKKGTLTVNSFGLLTYERDMQNAKKIEFEDPMLQGVYDAAVATFAHNALDIFSDCPSRERAGWLCDSYFTAKAEYFFFGKCEVEEAFLENYRLYSYDGELPHGVLPMCYPSCVENNGKFIPQWNMWYILEVYEFLTERSPETDKDIFRPSVMGILDFLEYYENELGLPEDLPSWNFVEWSTANEWVRNVNFPTCFLYAEALTAAYKLYGEKKLIEKAERIRKNALALSFDGEVFCDNAVRSSDKLERTKNSSEACQYYALLFGGIDIDSPEYKLLKKHILDGFCTFAQDTQGREFVPVNAFIGRYLRIMALQKMSEKAILLENIALFFGGMVSSTGTLWEYKQKKGSYDHGFASYAAVALAECIADDNL